MNNEIPETKFNVTIYQKDKSLRVAKSAKEALKGVVSKKKISILQKDNFQITKKRLNGARFTVEAIRP